MSRPANSARESGHPAALGRKSIAQPAADKATSESQPGNKRGTTPKGAASKAAASNANARKTAAGKPSRARSRGDKSPGKIPALLTAGEPPQTSTTSQTGGGSERPAHRWTFLTNHAHVLVLLKAEPELILREVANRVGITERAVQRIIQDLESAGFIRRQKVGRQNQYQVLTDQSLRHPIESHRTIGDLLRLIHG